MAVSLTNFLDSGCIVASSLALTAWAAAFNFGSAWTAILGAIGANAFGAAVGALIGGFLTDKFGRTTIYKYNLLVYAAGVFIAMVAVNLPMVRPFRRRWRSRFLELYLRDVYLHEARF